MNARIDAVDVRLESVTIVDEAILLWDERIAAREALLAELEFIDPPGQAAELHDAALDILRRLTAAEAAMGVKAAEFDDVNELGDNIWLTDEGRAATAIDEEAIAICQASQATFDDTAEREILAEVPWISSELKEVIDVAFGCTAAERGG